MRLRGVHDVEHDVEDVPPRRSRACEEFITPTSDEKAAGGELHAHFNSVHLQNLKKFDPDGNKAAAWELQHGLGSALRTLGGFLTNSDEDGSIPHFLRPSDWQTQSQMHQREAGDQREAEKQYGAETQGGAATEMQAELPTQHAPPVSLGEDGATEPSVVDDQDILRGEGSTGGDDAILRGGGSTGGEGGGGGSSASGDWGQRNEWRNSSWGGGNNWGSGNWGGGNWGKWNEKA